MKRNQDTMLDKLKTALDEISDANANTCGILGSGPKQADSHHKRFGRIIRGRHQGDISKTTKFSKHVNIAWKCVNYYRDGKCQADTLMVNTSPVQKTVSKEDSVCVIQELWSDFLKGLATFTVTGDVVIAVGMLAIATTTVAILVSPLHNMKTCPI